MRLYSGSSKDFIQNVVQNKIVDILTNAFIYENNYRPGNSEINSWRNSLRMMCLVFQDLKLNDQGVILEYQLPLTSKRLDCMICGRDKSGKDSSVIVELKQWEKCDSVSSDKVLTYTGQGMREVLHPSVQVGSYKEFLEDNHTAFYGENSIKLTACSFLHNYHSVSNDPIFSEVYKRFYEKYPLFLENDVEGLKKFILEKIINGYGMPIIKRVEESEYKPSKKLLKHVSDVIKNNSRYILLDDQLLAFERIIKQVEEYEKNGKKGVI